MASGTNPRDGWVRLACPVFADVWDGVQWSPCAGFESDDIDHRCPHCDHVHYHRERMVVRGRMIVFDDVWFDQLWCIDVKPDQTKPVDWE